MKSRWLATPVLAACLGVGGGSRAATEVDSGAVPGSGTEADSGTVPDSAEADSAAEADSGAASDAAPASPGSAAPLHIVLDPGHGGTNPGASGAAEGVLEKRVTLAVTQLLAAELRAAGFTVSLTRQGDRTLTLRQRSDLANRAGAALFISVHANASPSRSQRGFETYVLTPASVDIIAPALRSDEPAPRPGVPAAIASVLDDVERGAAQWEAADLATSVQSSLRAVRGREGDRGVRQDAQHVLLGATMPAVLVELGFVDHPIEGRELATPATQLELARALAAAISARAGESSP